jgi:hypothetical protein
MNFRETFSAVCGETPKHKSDLGDECRCTPCQELLKLMGYKDVASPVKGGYLFTSIAEGSIFPEWRCFRPHQLESGKFFPWSMTISLKDLWGGMDFLLYLALSFADSPSATWRETSKLTTISEVLWGYGLYLQMPRGDEEWMPTEERLLEAKLANETVPIMGAGAAQAMSTIGKTHTLPGISTLTEGVEFAVIQAVACGVPAAMVRYVKQNPDPTSGCLAFHVLLSLAQWPRIVPSIISNMIELPTVLKNVFDKHRSPCEFGIAVIDLFASCIMNWPSQDGSDYLYNGKVLWLWPGRWKELDKLKAVRTQMIDRCLPLLDALLSQRRSDSKRDSLGAHLKNFKSCLVEGRFDNWRVKFAIDRVSDFANNSTGGFYPKIVRNICAVCSKAGPLMCSVCRRVSYCGAECQRQDWDHHKKVCNKANSKGN